MRWFAAVTALLITGSVNTQDVPVTEATGVQGNQFTFNVIAISQTILSCHLTTPAEDTLDFYPDQPSPDDRFELQPISSILPACSITLNGLVGSDSGVWQIAFENATGDRTSAFFRLSVTPDASLSEYDDADATAFPTKVGQNIDISLSRTAYSEDCYIRKPGGAYVRAVDADIEGVKVHSSSDFVSCRVTIGPMNASLLGVWSLCGQRTDNQEERCQGVKLFWNNENSPDAKWESRSPSTFNHPVHFGGTLTPVVIGSGTPVTCHVITPNGEDLMLTADSDYPHLKLVSGASDACSVAIGPIAASLLGDWVLYGKFQDSFHLNEVRLPMHLFLYDEENPTNQAYNVTVLDSEVRIVTTASTLSLTVRSDGQVDLCQFRAPSGELYDQNSPGYDGAAFVKDDSIACRLTLGPITEKLLGDWSIIGKFRNNGLFTELQQTFQIVLEDPENPISDNRTVTYMPEQRVDSKIGESHRLVIETEFFVTGESCHVRTPNGLQYKIMDGFNLSGVEVIEDKDVECGIVVNVQSEDMVGTWTLIARAKRFTDDIERRLPFTIVVEETVNAVPRQVSVAEGSDLYIRLASPNDEYDSCDLERPSGGLAPFVRDPLHESSCGYIISGITLNDSGVWQITYGNKITYRALVTVQVIVPSDNTSFSTNVALVRDRPADQVVGPEDSTYCRLLDPQGIAVFDGFGKCTLALDKVTLDHHGPWRMVVATAGRVIATEHQLYVNVTEAEPRPVVETRVEQQKPIVTISCSVTSETVRACKFRDPQGRILLAAGGLGEDRYLFHGAETSYKSGVKTHECGLQITDPQISDLGLWRCGLETDEDIYYGFLDVLCPWALQDPSVAAQVQQEPILRSVSAMVTGVEDEPITVSCAIEAAIRYCYIRAQNGTTFSVFPGMSSANMEYVGAGFEAGECGVRFRGMTHRDSGHWSCHVGLVKGTVEQRDQFQLVVDEALRVNQSRVPDGVVVEGMVYAGRALEYCRYVRIDGLGFTTDSLPAGSGYSNFDDLSAGRCLLFVNHPGMLELHPWTVAAKIRGQEREVYSQTAGTFDVPPGPTFRGPSVFTIFLYVFLFAMLASVVLGACLGPKKNREWTYSRASALRRSIQRSTRKTPLDSPPSYTPSPATQVV